MATNKSFFSKSIATSLTLVGAVLVGVSESNAQDLLPRDNGIFAGHKSPRYRESESHPLRILAYALHPIGWVAREAIFRPFSAFAASTETTRSVMGYREPYDHREPLCFSPSDESPNCRDIQPYKSMRNERNGGSSESDANLRQVYFPEVNFDFNKSTLNDLGRAKVQQISKLLQSVSDVQIAVEGHTDYKGTDDYNMKLGEKRAQAVVTELAALGIPSSKLSPVSYGESKPKFTEETDWARAANRRVEFNVGGTVEAKEASELPAAALPESE